jgi:hypothetical protein
VTTWFTAGADACGSWDFNCDGTVEQQYSNSSHPIACGAAVLSSINGCH